MNDAYELEDEFYNMRGGGNRPASQLPIRTREIPTEVHTPESTLSLSSVHSPDRGRGVDYDPTNPEHIREFNEMKTQSTNHVYLSSPARRFRTMNVPSTTGRGFRRIQLDPENERNLQVNISNVPVLNNNNNNEQKKD